MTNLRCGSLSVKNFRNMIQYSGNSHSLFSWFRIVQWGEGYVGFKKGIFKNKVILKLDNWNANHTHFHRKRGTLIKSSKLVKFAWPSSWWHLLFIKKIVKFEISVRRKITVVSPRLIGKFEPILLRKTSDSAHFFLVRATEKIKTVLDQNITQQNYRRCKCWLSVFEHLKK